MLRSGKQTNKLIVCQVKNVGGQWKKCPKRWEWEPGLGTITFRNDNWPTFNRSTLLLYHSDNLLITCITDPTSMRPMNCIWLLPFMRWDQVRYKPSNVGCSVAADDGSSLLLLKKRPWHIVLRFIAKRSLSNTANALWQWHYHHLLWRCLLHHFYYMKHWWRHPIFFRW